MGIPRHPNSRFLDSADRFTIRSARMTDKFMMPGSRALPAAPAAIAKEAAIVRMDADGKPRTLREGKNGFTCMIIGGNKMCGDANSMEFFDAVMKHQPPPDKLGLSYMLAGDDGASNTDP